MQVYGTLQRRQHACLMTHSCSQPLCFRELDAVMHTGWLDTSCRDTSMAQQMLAWVHMLVLTLGASFGFPVEVSISSAPCNYATEEL